MGIKIHSGTENGERGESRLFDRGGGSLTPRVGHRISRKHEEALKALTTFETAVF